MAKFLDKDPYTYERERKTFLHALRQYHASKGVQPAMFRIPKVSGRDLDLYLLFSKVTSLGGCKKVTNEHRWDEVCEVLGFPLGCSQVGYIIRQHYLRYLESYEKVHCKGEDDDDPRGTKRPNTPISFAYRREISDKVRRSQGFALEKCRSSEYDRIIYSLQSGLPNEIDFAVNICTLLSNEGKHVIHLEKAPLLIDLLLAHAGVFYEGPGSLRKLYEESWREGAKRNFVQFWYDTIVDREVREVVGPASKKPEDKRHFQDPELFSMRKLGLSDVEGQRILQIAIIFRNLSFESHNISTMASHRTLYRFLLLLSHNSCTMLQQLGMDTLTNICSQLVLDSIDYVSTQLMLHTIHKGLENTDKFVILRSMELIEKLLLVESNLELFERCLEPTVYCKVVTLLTIHDIQLLLGALEVMLVMSEREEPFCTKLSSVHQSIDVLICLVTLDAQSLGAEAFVGIKIVDHAPDGVHHPIVTTGRIPGMQGDAPSLGPAPVAKPQTPPVQSRPPPAPSIMPEASPTPPPHPQGAPVRDPEMENLACQWLGAHYDSDPEGAISNIDLYAEYLSTCGKIMGRNIFNSNDFMRCVKIVFPAVEGKKAESEAGPQFFIAGIKRRQVPLPWKWHSSQSAPSPSASAMIAKMAQRHSPSPTVSPSPPPPKGGTFPQGVPHRQLIAPTPRQPQVQLPGQVNGQIPGHIHAPMPIRNQGQVQVPGVSSSQAPGHVPGMPGQVLGQQQGQMPAQYPVQQPGQPGQMSSVHPGQMSSAHPGQGPTPVHILGQTGQLPQQMRMPMPMSGHGAASQGQMVAARPPVNSLAQQVQPQLSSQPQMVHPQVRQAQPTHIVLGSPGQSVPGIPQSIPGQMQGQSNVVVTAQVSRPPQQQPQPHVTQGPPQQHAVPHISQGENVSVADIIAGNMRVPQQPLNYGAQNGKMVNGQIQVPVSGHAVHVPVNHNGAASADPNPSGTLTMGNVVQQTGNGLPSGLQLNAQGQSQEHYITLPVQNAGGHFSVPSSDTNSESSTELNPKSRSRNKSGKKSSSSSKSGRKTPSKQSSKGHSPSRSPGVADKPPKSPGAMAEDAPTEKCQPPLKVPLPDGEVRIEKIPNIHAVGMEEAEDDREDRTDVAEGIVRQIAGSPVLNQSSCDVPMEGSESVVSDVGTNDGDDVQHPGLNGDIAATPEPAQQHQAQIEGSRIPDPVPSNGAGVFSQPAQQVPARTSQQYQIAPSNNQVGNQMVMSNNQPQQQILIQQQIPTQCVVSRSVVNVQVQGGQTVLQTQPGTFVQAQPRNVPSGTQGTVIQTQGGNYVQVQPQLQVQGPQRVIQHPGQQIQTQVPLQVTWVQQPQVQGQIQQQVHQQQQLNVVTGVPQLQPGQTMIMTNNGQQATILSQNSGQLVVQNVNGPPRTGPKPILPQPPSTAALGPKPILPQPHPSTVASGTSIALGQLGKPILPQPASVVCTPQVQPTNVQITRFPGMQNFQGPLSPSNKDSPLIKRLLQQGPVLPPPGTTVSQQQQQQVQVISQQGQIVLNTIGQSQGGTMTVQAQGQQMPLSRVQVVTQFPPGMSVQASPTIGNIPQIQLHHPPILPAPPGTPSPNRTPKSKKKSKHKKKEKEKDKERDKNKNGNVKDNQSGVKANSGQKDVNSDGNKGNAMNSSIHVISEDGNKVVVGVVCNGVPVESRTENQECNNSNDVAIGQNQENVPKPGIPNGYISDKLMNSDVKLGKDGIVSPLVSKDIEALFKKSPQTIGDKVDSVVEQLKRDMSSSNAENGIIADKLGKPCLNHVVNGDVGLRTEAALTKDGYDGNNTVSDRLDRLLHGAVPNLSQPNIPNSSTPNPKSLVAFCNDIRPSFPSSVPSVTVAAVANANNNNQQNSCQSMPAPHVSVAQTGIANVDRTVSAAVSSASGVPKAEVNSITVQGGSSTPLPTSTQQTPLPPPAQHPPSPLTVQVPNPSASNPSFKRPIDDVLNSPDSKTSSIPQPSPTTSSAQPPASPSTPRASKKRRHSSSSSTSSSSRKSSTSAKSAPVVQKYICEWKGCSRKLTTAKALHTHACMYHILSINYRGVCEWEGCDRIQRQRWSVVSHIMDKHCSEQALQTAAEKRAQRAAQPTPPPSQDSSPQPPPIVYNAHTAYHAIRRSLTAPSLKDILGDNEGPVTKSIRLTAALILKNLATYSAKGRREIQRHELLLARLAISNTESSTTLAKCLKELDRDS